MHVDTLETMDLCKYADLVAALEYSVIAAGSWVHYGSVQQYSLFLDFLVCNKIGRAHV